MGNVDVVYLRDFRIVDPPGSGNVMNLAPVHLTICGYKVGDKIASESGHGTLSELPRGECEMVGIKLDSYDDETLAGIVSKSLYETQKQVAEKMIEIHKIELPPEDSIRFNDKFGADSFFSALLIENNKDEFPKLSSPEAIDVVCRIMPKILGRKRYEIKCQDKTKHISEYQLELKKLYNELLTSAGAEKKEEEFLRSIVLHDCAIHGENTVIGGCDACVGAQDCH